MELYTRAQQPTRQSLQPKPQLSVKGLHILIWCCFAVSTIALVTRVIARATYFRKIFSDDYAVLWAWVFLLGYSIVGTLIAPLALGYQGVSSGQRKAWPTYTQDSKRYQQLQYAQILIFVTSLYSIKLSFLLFFRRLSKNARTLGFEIYWWTTLVLVFLVYVGCWITQSLYCSGQASAKCITPYRLRMGVVGVKYSVGADVATDILIIGIPIYMLWGVAMPLRRKLLILSVLCAGLGIVVIALVRGAALKFGGNSALDRIIFWGEIELCVAFVLCSIASYKALFHGRKKTESDESDESASKSPNRSLFHLPQRAKKKASSSAIMTEKSINVSNSSMKNTDEDPAIPMQAYRGVPAPASSSQPERPGYGNIVRVASDNKIPHET